MAHFMCVTGTGEFCSFEKGYHRIGSIIQTEKYQYLFQLAKGSNDFKAFMKLTILYTGSVNVHIRITASGFKLEMFMESLY